MRILVTGHKGYIGSALVPPLLAKGYEVVGLDTDFYVSAAVGDLPKVPEIRKDIRDLNKDDLNGIDAIMHLAALSNDPIGNLNADLTSEINYTASVRLASLGKRVGVQRFIFSSSCSNYGAAGGNIMTEESPLNPVTAYGRSKVMTEDAVRKLATDAFSPVFLRNATAYGVSPRFRCDLVVNNMVAWAFTTGCIRILSDGTPWRPLVHVNDIANAFVAALEAPKDVVHNETFNIGRTEENYQVRQVADIIAEAMPAVSIEYAGQGGPDKRDYRVSFKKAESRLSGFVPRWTVQRAIEELVDFCGRAKITVGDIDGTRFARIARIKHLLTTGAIDSQLRWTPLAVERS